MKAEIYDIGLIETCDKIARKQASLKKEEIQSLVVAVVMHLVADCFSHSQLGNSCEDNYSYLEKTATSRDFISQLAQISMMVCGVQPCEDIGR